MSRGSGGEGGERWEPGALSAHQRVYRRPVVREPDVGLGRADRREVVAPDPATEAKVPVAGVVTRLPGDGMRRIERLDPIGHLVVPVRMAGVVHGHAEDLP